MTPDLFQPTPDEEVVGAGPLRALRWRATDLRAPQTLLLIHGIWTGAHVWRRMGPYLAQRGYTTYAVWLRHHHPGANQSQLRGLGMQDYVADVLAAVAELGAPVVVGHSMGGAIAQAVAARSQVAGLVLLASSAPRGLPTLPRPGLWLPSLRTFAGRPIRAGPLRMDFAYARRTFFHRLSEDEAKVLHANQVPEPRRVAREVAFWPPRAPRRRVQCPVMVASGAEDSAIIPWVAKRLAKRYRIVAQLYPGMGHMLNLEPGWERVADDVMRWTDRFVA